MRARSFCMGLAFLVSGAFAAQAADPQCATVKAKDKRARCECVTDNGGVAWPNPGKGLQWGKVPRTMTGLVSACMTSKGFS